MVSARAPNLLLISLMVSQSGFNWFMKTFFTNITRRMLANVNDRSDPR